jgi:hypothetical protein
MQTAGPRLDTEAAEFMQRCHAAPHYGSTGSIAPGS